ncbi:MAG: M20/M25/M40 family metallo-hydrolase [Gemmatimonadaceae bacterium]|nr:M20/M25/M40 family metallo-hydrolase [Gemmatimonadaceae bacterium]
MRSLLRCSPIRTAVLSLPLVAAQSFSQVTPGYSATSAVAQRRLEQEAIRGPVPARARTLSAALSKEPHVAGTPAQKRTADYVIAQMKAMGLETELRQYDVWLPHATSVKITRLGRTPLSLDLSEPPVPGDPATALKQYPTVNGSSGAGVGDGELVFVNYGLIEDYATLDSLGVSVKGKVVLARYGRSFRGIKAREAEKRGAVAALIYTDPADDGFARGDVYPEGPMRPMRGVQRGSVYNGAGDPLTPGYASKPGAPRIPLDQAVLPMIPVVPISAANAQVLLAQVRGTAIPAGWQGGMALRYHVGPGPTRVRVEVTTDAATNGTKAIYNTLGYLRGTDFPDEYVYIGGHRDGWGPGAADNISGTVSILEAARALSDMARNGTRPRRTIVFATWDAEEWGLVGSSEYVEDDSLRLQKGAVAYFNQDVAAQGSSFGGGGTPSLRAVLRDVVKSVPDPKSKGTVYDAWRAASGLRADTLEPAMGDPGGGSDFAGFYNHLGIPIAEWGFGGPAGTYHSAYDTHAWMERFGDPGFLYHATAARIGAAMALRVANADILPYDYVEFARTMRRYVAPLARGLAAKGWDSTAATPLAAAIGRLERSAQAFATARDAELARGVARQTQLATNTILLKVERAFARSSGLKGRPWYRSLIYVADIDNGYANMNFPGVNEAIRAGDRATTTAELADLIQRFGVAADLMDQAAKLVATR